MLTCTVRLWGGTSLSLPCHQVPELGKKAIMIAIPTTSGTGSEVTPFSVVTDDSHVGTGLAAKYPLADYALTPSMAIVGASDTMTITEGVKPKLHVFHSPLFKLINHCCNIRNGALCLY